MPYYVYQLCVTIISIIYIYNASECISSLTIMFYLRNSFTVRWISIRVALDFLTWSMTKALRQKQMFHSKCYYLGYLYKLEVGDSFRLVAILLFIMYEVYIRYEVYICFVDLVRSHIITGTAICITFVYHQWTYIPLQSASSRHTHAFHCDWRWFSSKYAHIANTQKLWSSLTWFVLLGSYNLTDWRYNIV